MAIREADPWRFQYFDKIPCPAGVDIPTVAHWLGHKDGGVLVAMTYGHLRSEHSVAMAKRITFDAETSEAVNANVVALPMS